jgi:hypothetical protein
MADYFGDDAMKASKKAHDSGERAHHQEAAFMHAKAADAQRSRGNTHMAMHHARMADMHEEECGPESYEEDGDGDV